MENDNSLIGKNFIIEIKNIYKRIEELKINISRKEDDFKNIINEKDNLIEILNEKIITQEKRIEMNEREIKNLNDIIKNQENKIQNNKKEIKNLYIISEADKKQISQIKSKVCKLILKNGNCPGFFCKIKFPNDKLMPVLITNNHYIDESMLENESQKIYYSIYNQRGSKYIRLNNRIKYTSKKYNITIIEIKENDNINEDMFFDIELNENNIKYSKNAIYVLHPNEKEILVSYGILNEICEDKKYEFQHYCTNFKGSSGSPILDILNNKIFGMHKISIGENYNLGTFINYPINEFIEENYIDNNLNEFNKKFNLNIKYNITNLDLRRKNIECINFLKNLSLKELKELNLYGCRISDIGFLEKVHFEKLEKLDLRNNKISNINLLEKVNFKELKELYLSSCGISDISFLENVNFEKLEKLYLSKNKISNIKILEKVNFTELKELYLSSCGISDTKFLENVNFEKLEKLSLRDNKILNISIFKKVNFKELKELYLSSCGISDISSLENVNFEKLEKLFLRNNKISNINILEKINFKKLKELDLSECEISDIKFLEKGQFEKLEKLYLTGNKISNVNLLEKVNFKELKELYLNLDEKILKNLKIKNNNYLKIY